MVNDQRDPPAARLSYKFQRLRERLRVAIHSGELCGRLPGERQLARQFRVNAKTLSKALTDLAAEGLLERRIGRGTYVRRQPAAAAPVAASDAPAAPAGPGLGHPAVEPPAPAPAAQRWLVICDDIPQWQPVLDRLQHNSGAVACEVQPRLVDARPSAVAGFTAAIDFSPDTPQPLTRDLIVRGLSVVKVDHVPQTYSTSAVLIDRQLGANNLVRHLLLRGHRRIFVVEKPGGSDILPVVQDTAQRFGDGASVDAGRAEDAVAAVRQGGATAVVCCCAQLGERVARAMEDAGISVPREVSLAALGVSDDPPCTGVYVHPDHMADTITRLARPSSPRRPTVLWLNGSYHDARTCDAPPGGGAAAPGLQPPPPSRDAAFD